MNYVQMTVFSFCIIFVATITGSFFAFAVKKKNIEKINLLSMGFSSGVMLAASVWSLLLPSIELSETANLPEILPPVSGLLAGALFMTAIGRLKVFENGKPEAIKPVKLFIAVTVHNVPEGLAVGFSFGAAKLAGNDGAYFSALMFAVGIAIQNIPEGAAVSLPFLSVMKNKTKAFLFGALSGLVEPLFAVAGYCLSESLSFLQPYLLAFSAGAMIFVVFDDLLPEKDEKNKIDAWAIFSGFIIMMALDVCLG